jgi:phage-related tail protein
MAQVAQNLGNVMQSAILSALSSAKVAASGAGAAMQAYEQTLMSSGQAAANASPKYTALMGDLENLGYSAKQAAQLIAMVAGNMNQVQSKTVTLTVDTNYVTSGGMASAGINPGALPGIAHHAAGTPSAKAGWSWVGEAGPELVRFRGGETVVPNHVATGYANGAGDFGSVHQVNVFLNGKQLYSEMQKEAAQSQRRTGSTGMGRRTR